MAPKHASPPRSSFRRRWHGLTVCALTSACLLAGNAAAVNAVPAVRAQSSRPPATQTPGSVVSHRATRALVQPQAMVPILPFRLITPVARVTRNGNALLLDGRPWKFTGVNAFGATTDWSVNWGCGSPVQDLDQMFGTLRPGSVVRTWAFQSLAWNNKAAIPHQDFSAIDRVVAAATRHHQLLILTLSDQAGTCDDGVWKNPDWYQGGFTRRPDPSSTDGRQLGNLSYQDYVKAIVGRYRNSPAIAFWEPMNEAEASQCTGAAGSACWQSSKRSCDDSVAGPALRSFFDQIGQVIRSADPNHLISSGLAGQLTCGIDSGWHRYVGNSPGIDLLSYHDYSSSADSLPYWLGERLSETAPSDMNKPMMVGEVGVGSCDGDRPAEMAQKLQRAFAAGAVGYLPWWYAESPSRCGQDLGPGDPVLTVLANAPTS